MIRFHFSLVICLLLVFSSLAQPMGFTALPQPPSPEKPKLIVGIVVDQMRYDLLNRYWSKYGDGGFKRLVNNGYSCNNTQFNYYPTFTGPGHANIYAGSVPSIDGLVSNTWYDARNKKTVYVTSDPSVKAVGSSSLSGMMSPKNMLTTTVTDELRMASNFGSKVISVSLKDRSAILPAGHTGNAAYWFDGSSGNFYSSTYYMNSLPAWVNSFNERKLAEQYLSKDWNTLLPLNEYTESTNDTALYEETFYTERLPVFPHAVSVLRGSSYEIIKSTPYGNNIVKDMALAAIKGENMGKGSHTDFLCISFSSTDYVGHQFGPNSVEIEDTYLKLDKDLTEMLSFLDSWLGKQNILVFLTADHGVSPIPAYASAHGIPSGVMNENILEDSVKMACKRQFGDTAIIEMYMNQQFYLNQEVLKAKKLSKQEVLEAIRPAVMQFEGIRDVFPTDDADQCSLPDQITSRLKNTYYPSRSGDLMIMYQPYWIGDYSKGTTHGSVWSYDTHVPLLWYGWRVKKGSSSAEVQITDIAPTLSDMLKIMEPNGCIGKPIQGLGY